MSGLRFTLPLRMCCKAKLRAELLHRKGDFSCIGVDFMVS